MLQKNNFKNTGFYFFTFIFSATYLSSALTLGPPIEDSQLTLSFFPLILGTLSVLVSLCLLFNTIRSNRVETQQEVLPEPANSKGRYLALMAIAATAVFVLLFQTLGFFVTTIPYVFSIILIFSNREKLLQKLFFSILIVALGYLMFAEIFNVRLPTLLEL